MFILVLALIAENPLADQRPYTSASWKDVAILGTEGHSLVSWHPRRREIAVLLSETDSGANQLLKWPGGQRLKLGFGPEYMRWNARGDRLLLGNKSECLVLDWPKFTVAKHLKNVIAAWWRGNELGWVSSSESRQAVHIGRLVLHPPRGKYITAVTSDGGAFFARPAGSSLAKHRTPVMLFLNGSRLRSRPADVTWDLTMERLAGDFVEWIPGSSQLLLGIGDSATPEMIAVYVYDTNVSRVRAFWPDKLCWVPAIPCRSGNALIGLVTEVWKWNLQGLGPRSRAFVFKLTATDLSRFDVEQNVDAFAVGPKLDHLVRVVNDGDNEHLQMAEDKGTIGALRQRIYPPLRPLD